VYRTLDRGFCPEALPDGLLDPKAVTKITHRRLDVRDKTCRQVYRTLERGFCPEALPDEGGLLERRELRQRLLKVLRQDEPAKCYFLITGRCFSIRMCTS